MKAGKKWTRDELILAINLYCKTPFGRIHVRNPDIINLARRLDRTPGSISYKLANFASIDPSLPRKGAANVSSLDKQVWSEFFENWEDLAFESERLMVAGEHDASAGGRVSSREDTARRGETRGATVKARVNQQFFRTMVLASYDFRCCVTGLPVVDVLVASHIVPWARDEKNRLNPRNGLCLNALHDRAFDRGLISFDEDYTLLISSRLGDYEDEEVRVLVQHAQRKLALPRRFLPDPRLLAFHRTEIFQR
jgi:putative restriction endonuclease